MYLCYLDGTREHYVDWDFIRNFIMELLEQDDLYWDAFSTR